VNWVQALDDAALGMGSRCCCGGSCRCGRHRESSDGGVLRVGGDSIGSKEVVEDLCYGEERGQGREKDER
jgi:hypothetical protein